MTLIGEFVNHTPDPRSVEKSSIIVPSTLFGVEVELENVPGVIGSRMKYWNVKEDGSLRNNGAEFVFKQPLGGSDIVRAFVELDSFINGNGLNPATTDRTSVHVHMDVRPMETYQFQKLMVLYTIFEKVLFNYAGPNRYNNIFCLPIQNVQGMVKYLNLLFKCDGNTFNAAIRAVEKYSAININSLRNFGSIEFRMHQGEWRSGKLIKWINILSHLYQSSLTDEAILEIHSNISGSGPSRYLEKVFGKTSKYLMYDDVDIDIMEGVRLSQDIINYDEMQKSGGNGTRILKNDLFSKYKEKHKIVSSDDIEITVEDVIAAYRCTREGAERAIRHGLSRSQKEHVTKWIMNNRVPKQVPIPPDLFRDAVFNSPVAEVFAGEED